MKNAYAEVVKNLRYAVVNAFKKIKKIDCDIFGNKSKSKMGGGLGILFLPKIV